MLVLISDGPHKGTWLDIYEHYLDGEDEIIVRDGHVYAGHTRIGYLDDLLVDGDYRST